MFKLLTLFLLLQANPADELTTLLEQAKPSQPKAVRLEALEKLKNIAETDPQRIQKSLEPYADEKDAEIRCSVLLVIGLSGIEQTPCPMCIVKALNDDNDLIRTNASALLSLYGKYPREAVPLLFAAVDSHDATVRSSIAEALPKAAGNTPEVKQALRKLISDSNLNVRHSGQQAYYHLTGDIVSYVEYLLRITADRSNQPEPKSDEEQNQRIAEDNFSVIGAMILYSLTREKSDELAKSLIHHLTHDDAAIRQCALRQLRAMCIGSQTSFRSVAAQKPQEKLKALQENDQNEMVRTWAGVVIDLLEAGPPKDAPEQLEPLETLNLEFLQKTDE